MFPCLEFQLSKGELICFFSSLMKIVFDLFSFLIQVVTEPRKKKKKEKWGL